MRLILIGPQGSGKGTQGDRLAKRYGVAHIATGDLLRAAATTGTELGLRAKNYMDRGELVPDELVLAILETRLAASDAEVGFVLDGYPRNAAQVASLTAMLGALDHELDAVVSLEVPGEILVARMSQRGRADDTPEAIRRRLDLFWQQTAPLLEHYERGGLLERVDGVGEKEEVEERVAKALADR